MLLLQFPLFSTSGVPFRCLLEPLSLERFLLVSQLLFHILKSKSLAYFWVNSSVLASNSLIFFLTMSSLEFIPFVDIFKNYNYCIFHFQDF